MSLLFKNLRVHQIFGANTDVGKTILTTALVRGSAALKNEVYYLKPISTGPMEEADDEHIKRYSGSLMDRIHTECLYRFHVPVSPHLAAQMALGDGSAEKIVSDSTFVNSVASYVRRCAGRAGPTAAHMYVETAGGVHSPTLSGATQADCYRPLFLPTVLIGDSRLGGISSTISAYESLILRGYIVDSILLFRDTYYRNSEYLTPYFAERGVAVTAFDPPPPKLENLDENYVSTQQYYDQLDMAPVLSHLDEQHSQRLAELSSMPKRSMNTFWWPFVQHGLVKSEADVTVIDHATSDFFSVYKPDDSSSSQLKSQFDGSASWWTQALGHGNSALTLAAARATGRYGHVIFPQATHAPALQLAETLVRDGPGKGWASRVFFSDDGSTGMEVALKMALRAFSVRHGLEGADRKTVGVLGLRGSYHGDTIGAMDACIEEGVYTCEWHNAKGFWFDPPAVSIRDGRPVITLPTALAASGDSTVLNDDLSWIYDVNKRLETSLASTYREWITKTLDGLEKAGGPRLAALVLEPLILGAGGMIFVDPLFQRVLVDTVRARGTSAEPGAWQGLPVIFDEVFVGLYRLGMKSTIPLLGVTPDISVHAKILTGGIIPLAVTLATDSIFQAFYGPDKATALLHGHSYTAHVMGCEVANETLRLIDKEASSESWAVAKTRWEPAPGTPSTVWSVWDLEFLKTLSRMDVVDEVMALGTVLAIKVKDAGGSPSNSLFSPSLFAKKRSAGYVSMSAQTKLNSIRFGDSEDASTTSFGIHFRTLGNVAYFMTSLNTEQETVRAVEDKIWTALSKSS
ncbi:unnamed protein product [Mycena citricolor]|uniref:Onanonoxo-7-onima-8-eninoihtemlysoneda n=1 Tax=Mycena citricolor TaxID=2018698 RepID=A0AAD2JVT5_9AGAR|nr:unnamed protein product [Mycena citricolor]